MAMIIPAYKHEAESLAEYHYDSRDAQNQCLFCPLLFDALEEHPLVSWPKIKQL
jgi:hypothetical protein